MTLGSPPMSPWSHDVSANDCQLGEQDLPVKIIKRSNIVGAYP